jgi:hypothetical protein
MSAESVTAPYSGPVTELAVRRMLSPDAGDAFTAARERFVGRLRTQPGVRIDREFAAIVDFQTFAAPEPGVFVGMTEYDDLTAFAAAGAALGASPEAQAFFAEFTPIVFTALRPLADEAYDLSALATKPGQVLEIAHRDLSAYDGFDQGLYDAARTAFLDDLRAQPGVAAEYQWRSLIDPNIVVGMTVYDSMEAFQALASSAFLRSATSAAFVGGYPPASGHLVVDARR